MEMVLDPAGLPEHGTVVVPVSHDGKLGRIAARLEEATQGLVSRALANANGGLKHGRALDLFLPAGLSLDRLILLPLGKPDRMRELLERAGMPMWADGGGVLPAADSGGAAGGGTAPGSIDWSFVFAGLDTEAEDYTERAAQAFVRFFGDFFLITGSAADTASAVSAAAEPTPVSPSTPASGDAATRSAPASARAGATAGSTAAGVGVTGAGDVADSPLTLAAGCRSGGRKIA